MNDTSRARPWMARTGKGELLGMYATSAEAVLALDEYNARHSSVARMRYTFRDVYEKWKAVHFADVDPKGQYSYEQAFSKAVPLHDREMRDLKTEDYQQIISALAESGLSRSTCEKQRQLFSQLCKWAQSNDIIATNYAESLKLPSAAPPPPALWRAKPSPPPCRPSSATPTSPPPPITTPPTARSTFPMRCSSSKTHRVISVTLA